MNGKKLVSIVKFSKDAPRFAGLIFYSLKNPLLVFLALAGNACLLVCAAFFYFFEHPSNPAVKSFWDAVWWAFCTVSTVGYGDIFPMTVGGRVAGIFLIIVGVFFFLSFMAILGSIILAIASREIVHTEHTTMKEYHHLLDVLKKISKDMDELKNKIEK